MRPGDPLGDYTQRAITLTLILKPVVANEDGVGVSTPLTNQCRAGLQHDSGIKRRAALSALSNSLQAAPQGPAGSAIAPLLQLVSEGSDQQIATNPKRRFGAMKLAPGKPQLLCRAIE